MTYVKDFLNSNNLALIATLETRVKKHKANQISSSIAGHWNWVYNYEFNNLGCIWIGNFWNVQIISKSAQQITEFFDWTLNLIF